jgi:hypothetical protein
MIVWSKASHSQSLFGRREGFDKAARVCYILLSHGGKDQV